VFVVVIISGGSGSGKTETLKKMRRALAGRAGEVATLETDTFYTMIDPEWSIDWPEAENYFRTALDMVARTALGLMDSGFEWLAIGSNGLYERETVHSFIAPFRDDARARIHHVTLDPGVETVQARIAKRNASEDAIKTPDWLASQVKWFRERYGNWTHVIDNSKLTPEETAVAIHEAVCRGHGLSS